MKSTKTKSKNASKTLSKTLNRGGSGKQQTTPQRTSRTKTKSKNASKTLNRGGSGKQQTTPQRTSRTKTKSANASKNLTRGGSGKQTTSTQRGGKSSKSSLTISKNAQTLRTSTLKARADRSAKSKSNNKALIAGQSVNLTTEPNKAAILKGTEKFMRTQPTNNYAPKTATTAQVATQFLHLIGVCTDSSKGAAYSLLDDQSDKLKCNETSAENPNILDESTAKNQKKEYPTGEDKFPSQDDPFYEEDEAQPLASALQELDAQTAEQEAQKTISFAAALATANAGIEKEETTPTSNSDTYQVDQVEGLSDTTGGSSSNVATWGMM